jgi:flagellar motor switch protein FliN
MAHDERPWMTETPAFSMVGEWSECFSTDLREIAGIAVTFEMTPAHDVPPAMFRWQQEFSIQPDQPITIGVTKEGLDTISAAVGAALGLTGEAAPADQRLYIAVMRKSMVGLALALSRESSQIVATAGDGEAADLAVPGNTYQIAIAFAERNVTLYVTIPRVWEEWRLGHAREESKASSQPTGSLTLPLLLDVEVPIRVCFGRTSLKVNDALKLVTGSLLELDRGAGESVELIVSNRVIAHGEVVAVDGNYGIRITQIVSRKERLIHDQPQLTA